MAHTSRAPRALLLAQLSNSVGDGAFYVTSALYFSEIVGLSAARIGVGLTAAWAVGSVAGVWLGHVADRRGPRSTAVLLALATAAAVGSFLVIRSFVPFLIAAAVYATAQSGLAAARQALLAGLVEPSARTEVLARLQSTLNAGLAVGAGLGGLALHACTRTAYLAVLVLGAVLQVIAEMRHSAGSWQIGFTLAPAGRIGQYQGFYGTGVPVARTLGPSLVTALLVTWGAPGWLVLGGIFLLAGAVTGPAVRWAERSRARAQAPVARGAVEPLGAH